MCASSTKALGTLKSRCLKKDFINRCVLVHKIKKEQIDYEFNYVTVAFISTTLEGKRLSPILKLWHSCTFKSHFKRLCQPAKVCISIGIFYIVYYILFSYIVNVYYKQARASLQPGQPESTPRIIHYDFFVYFTSLLPNQCSTKFTCSSYFSTFNIHTN